MHVVVAATQRRVELACTHLFAVFLPHPSVLDHPHLTSSFAREVVDSVIIDNVNPITRMVRSLLTLATTIHRTNDPTLLLQPTHVQHVREHSSDLFGADE